MFVQGRLLAPDWGNYPSLPPPTQSPFCPPTVKQTLYSSLLLRIVQKKIMLTEHLYVNSLERLFENTGVALCLNRVSISIEKAKRDMAGWETGREKAENSLHSPQCCYSISSWLPASPLVQKSHRNSNKPCSLSLLGVSSHLPKVNSCSLCVQCRVVLATCSVKERGLWIYSP